MFMQYKPMIISQHLALAGVFILGILSILGSGGGGGGDSGETPDTTAPITTADPPGGSYDAIQQVSLTANESSTIYYSTDGVAPSEGAANTTSGTSPIAGITIPEGTTPLKYFAVDTAGNIESVNTATYVIDATPPNAAFTGGTPSPIGLLQSVSVTWQSDEDVTYIVELGGSGAVGSGIQIAAGSVMANIPVIHSIPGWKLSYDAATEIWLYVTDSFGHESSDFDSLALKSPVSITNVNSSSGIRFNGTSTRAYVIGAGFKVLDIDTTSGNYNSEIASVTVGSGPVGLAITPDDSRVYVTNQSSNNISVVDTATNTVVATVAPGSATPQGIDITPDGTRAYFTTRDGMVRVLSVDPGSGNYHTVISSIFIQVLFLGGQVAITPDGANAVVNWFGLIANAVDVLDVDPASPFYNLPVGHPVPVVTGDAGGKVITSPDSLSAYATTGWASCQLCRIDLSDYSIPASNASRPTGIAITPDGNKLLATYSNEIGILDPDDLTELGSVPMSGGLSAISITPDGTRAYASHYDSSLSVYETVMLPLY